MRLSRLALLPAAAVLIAACSSGPGSTATPSAGATPSMAATASPPASAAAIRIEVQLTDALRIEPAEMSVPAGVPVTFVVTNTGSTDHEFYLGDEEAQAEHGQEMAEMGSMGHDEPEGIGVDPGETKELTYTFAEPGEALAGCHVAGHYAVGMKATIIVGG